MEAASNDLSGLPAASLLLPPATLPRSLTTSGATATYASPVSPMVTSGGPHHTQQKLQSKTTLRGVLTGKPPDAEDHDAVPGATTGVIQYMWECEAKV